MIHQFRLKYTAMVLEMSRTSSINILSLSGCFSLIVVRNIIISKSIHRVFSNTIFGMDVFFSNCRRFRQIIISYLKYSETDWLSTRDIHRNVTHKFSLRYCYMEGYPNSHEELIPRSECQNCGGSGESSVLKLI